MSGITDPDAVALDALARLQLTARRFGVTIRLQNAGPDLARLIECAGLADVLIVCDAGGAGDAGSSGVEVDRQVEEGEQGRVDEEVHGGDGAV